MTRFELPLRPDVKAIILTPHDLTLSEAETIQKYIEYLKSISKKLTGTPYNKTNVHDF